MGDNWDDSDDDWDVDDDELDAKLGIKKPANDFDDEEDLALKEKRAADAAAQGPFDCHTKTNATHTPEPNCTIRQPYGQ